MAEDKDRNQDYYFMREVIKKKPLDKRKIGYTVAAVVTMAVVFGVISAFVFSKALPLFQPDETRKVSIPQDSSEKKGQITPTPEPEKQVETHEVIVEKEGLTLENYRAFYDEMIEIAKESEKSVVEVQGITSDVDWMDNSYENSQQVSGVLVADNESDYFIVTEYRAVDKVDRILISFTDGKMADAHFQKKDMGTGLAVLKVAKKDVPKETREKIEVAKLGTSYSIKRGEQVFAIGSPGGYEHSLAFGMVTSTENTKNTVDNEYHLLTTDIMGSSTGSGVLVSLEGKIVGIIVQSFSGEEEKNVVTALPISEVKGLIEKLSNKEDLIYLGVRGQNIGNDLAQKTGLPRGIYVNGVNEDSPAMSAGIQNGDVIVKVKDANVECLSDLRRELDQYEKKQKITITAMRKGVEGYVEIVFDVSLGAL